jgi:hypothetical protein
MHPMGVMDMGSMAGGGARLLDAPRHRSPGKRAQRKARRKNCGQHGAEHTLHAHNVAADLGGGKSRSAAHRGSLAPDEPLKRRSREELGDDCRLVPSALPPVTRIGRYVRGDRRTVRSLVGEETPPALTQPLVHPHRARVSAPRVRRRRARAGAPRRLPALAHLRAPPGAGMAYPTHLRRRLLDVSPPASPGIPRRASGMAHLLVVQHRSAAADRGRGEPGCRPRNDCGAGGRGDAPADRRLELRLDDLAPGQGKVALAPSERLVPQNRPALPGVGLHLRRGDAGRPGPAPSRDDATASASAHRAVTGRVDGPARVGGGLLDPAARAGCRPG